MPAGPAPTMQTCNNHKLVVGSLTLELVEVRVKGRVEYKLTIKMFWTKRKQGNIITMPMRYLLSLLIFLITLSVFFGPLILGKGVPFGGTGVSNLLVTAPRASSTGLKYCYTICQLEQYRLK